MSIVGKCAAVVAHPDYETLWVGGTILKHPDCGWTVITLRRKGDPDRAPRFFEAMAASKEKAFWQFGAAKN